MLASLLFVAACGSAYADHTGGPARLQIAPQIAPQIAIQVAPAKVRAPYDVQVVREDGEVLPTYAARDRFYVAGVAGERYSIEISNPTGHRVEAVVTVDGLDAVDGENGDLRKRGYIVPAWGETRIEGFRTSLADVATFRFSSVDGSYAGQKGKARNVGVIAVALFEEAAPAPAPVVMIGRSPGARRVGAASPASPKAAARAGDLRDTDTDTETDGGGVAALGEAAPAPRTNRPGLGTELGESRVSAASYTRFVRSTTRPIAIAELHYNDAAGLMALGIPVEPMPDEDEMMTRETADPFPGDHFARRVR